jgi:16S rRNA (guanine527-N7)-methyltransferase
LSADAVDALFAHYSTLREWAPKVDLIGPGAAAELFERHYGEALAALPWLPQRPFRLVDIGSGAGFPGFVLAAARPDAESVLVEPRERRRAFLLAAARRARLAVRCLGARVSPASIEQLPQAIDLVTVRALRLDSGSVAALARRLAPGARLIGWIGKEEPFAPTGLFETGRTAQLPNSRGRYLREYLYRGEMS